MSNMFPFKLTRISPLDSDIDVILSVDEIGQIPGEPELPEDTGEETPIKLSYESGKLVLIEYKDGETISYTYIDNVGSADHGLLETSVNTKTGETKTFTYDDNGVILTITVS